MIRMMVLCLAIGVAAEPAAAAGPYDGRWHVHETCENSGDVAGYIFDFDAAVHDGMLVGRKEQDRRSFGTLTLRGRIAPDGTAILSAVGTTGRPDTAFGHVRYGSPTRYHVNASFSASSGTGSRVELRRCAFSFTRL